MALFATQLQPWEEQTSPSPTEEVENPYELALARSRSSSKSGHSQGQVNRQNSSGSTSPGRRDSKPPSPINTLHRQLSGDPDAPPPAWKRRSSVNNGNGPPSASRRHPGLQMTLSANNRQPLPDQQPLYESSPDPNGDGNGDAADLGELGLPQPAFRRRSNASSGRSSNRSSTHSLNGLTSEELWQLDHPDLSNPSRQSRERPLDTVRRMSRTFEQPQPWQQGGFPGEVIWPAALPGDTPAAPVLKSKSTTNVPGAAPQKQKRLTIRKKSSRQQSLDTATKNEVYLHGPGAVSPNSLSRPDSMILSSSAQSSTTSLNSQGNFSPVKVVSSNVTLNNRPPSTYYSRDFLSSLAPREGGYAIAATMGNGLGAHGAMSVDERRRSQYDPSIRRAPMAKSAGMGRWSLDGGEHYNRPYGTASAATTASNLSAPPITSPETSPPLEDARLPEGAAASPSPSAPAMTRQPDSSQSADSITPTNTGSAAGPTVTIPVNPSPLSQQTHASEVATPKSERAPPVPAPVPVTASAVAASPLNTKKSKKELKQEAQRQKIEEHKRKAEAKAAAAKAKADKKEAEQKAKAEAKRKEKEAKEKRKAEKKAGKSSSFASLPAGSATAKKEPAPPVPAVPASATPTSPVPFPRTTSTPTATGPPKVAPAPSRPAAVSMPLDSARPAPAPAPAPAQTLKEKPSRLSLFGTLKKRFSSGPNSSQADVRLRQASDAANVGSMPKPPPAQAQAQAASPHVATPAAVTTSPTRAHVIAPSPPPGGAEAVPIQTHSTSVHASSSPVLAPATVPTASSPQPSVKSGRSNSVRGPRPMPLSNNASPERAQSRPTSLITTPSTEAAPVTPAAGFPFQPKGLGMMNPEIVTPSTSTESSMFSSSHTAEHSSPFTSVGSRKSSLTADDPSAPAGKTLPPAPVEGAGQVPERGDSATSKSSEETLQPRAPPMVM